MPKRIQLRRTKGWRKPEGAIVVARPSKWGNPFRAGSRLVEDTPREALQVVEDNAAKMGILHYGHVLTAQESVALFRVIAEREFRLFGEYNGEIGWNPADLRGKDLACWCPITKGGRYVQCHADVLLCLANDMSMEQVQRENTRWTEGKAMQ